ncbi:hypothetical protein BU23DRAFT_142039 [Bimuria novae-zelandiae CBS 107.79]|uniref:Secreted protein n=1 Tax=Bimuria novae-zelandiae CBS 107.79 TaxID=1447943 RepID=A0A6A5V9Q8_9PLEO|nr:hypothetical protein BU23DRAFT_142039 [Bimuria novae-zelandiae CBS 107.79]
MRYSTWMFAACCVMQSILISNSTATLVICACGHFSHPAVCIPREACVLRTCWPHSPISRNLTWFTSFTLTKIPSSLINV